MPVIINERKVRLRNAERSRKCYWNNADVRKRQRERALARYWQMKLPDAEGFGEAAAPVEPRR